MTSSGPTTDPPDHTGSSTSPERRTRNDPINTGTRHPRAPVTADTPEPHRVYGAGSRCHLNGTAARTEHGKGRRIRRYCCLPAGHYCASPATCQGPGHSRGRLPGRGDRGASTGSPTASTR
jgi:hypothetical protein